MLRTPPTSHPRPGPSRRRQLDQDITSWRIWPMSSNDSIQTAMLLFSQYDVNGDGEVSREELKEMLLRKCQAEGISPDLETLEKQVISNQ